MSTVHEDLQKVVHRAIVLTSVDFAVVQGRRTWDEQAQLYGKGRTAGQMAVAVLPTKYAQPNVRKVTWTMKSNHLSGHAVDLAAFVDGAITWDTSKGYYEAIADAMKQAAAELGIAIKWGGDWKATKDYPHFELVR